MTVPRKPIATSNQLATCVMGRLGKGPADRANLIGTIVDQGYDYSTADSGLDELLAFMVERGHIEAVAMPSHYVKGATYAVYRLPGSVPMELPAVPEESSATRPGFISASDYRAQGGKRKGGRG